MLKKIALLKVKNFIFYISDLIGAFHYLIKGFKPREGLTVLCYHSTADKLPRFSPYNPYNVTLETFAKQIKIIKKATLLKVVDTFFLTDKDFKGTYCLWITFDDGYMCNMRAAELLKENKLKATFFICTDYIDTEYFNFSRFDSWCKDNIQKEWYLPMSLDNLRELSRMGFDIQSHGCSHRSLGHLSYEEINHELSSSKEFFERELSRKVIAMSYPFGSSYLGNVIHPTKEALLKNQYSIGCTTDAGYNTWENFKQDKLGLKRIPVNSWDRGITFQAKINGYSGLLHFLKFVLHKFLKGGKRQIDYR